MNRNYSLSKFEDLIKGYELDPAIEREVILCLVALYNNGCRIGDAVEVNHEIFLMGFRGLFTMDLEIEYYETFGYTYLETFAKKTNKKLIQDNYNYGNVIGMLDAEREGLAISQRKRFAPKDLKTNEKSEDNENHSCLNIINEKDKQLSELQNKYEEAQKEIDMLINRKVDEVREKRNKEK